MSQSYSLFLPSYTIGPDCYKEIPAIVKRYGKKIVLVGGKTLYDRQHFYNALIT